MKAMIYSLSGTLVGRRENYAIVEAGGIGFKVLLPLRTVHSLPQNGSTIKLYCAMYSRESAPFDLFGFTSEQDLYLFEKLNTVSGVGPKTALSIMSIGPTDQLITAINSGKIELLTKASGIGKKTAERVIVDLKEKLDGGSAKGTAQTLTLMESDLELEETLVSLGYTKGEAKTAISKIDPAVTGFKERLKEALKKQKP